MTEQEEQNTPDTQVQDKDPATLELAALQESLESYKDKALRAMAELENFKKRKEQEVAQFKTFAASHFVLALLPVLDSFDRACAFLGEAPDEQAQGFLMIQKQFHDVLEKMGVTPIEAVNQPFDPQLHQAVMEEEAPEVAPGTVLRDMQKGYRLHDRVIRPSMAVVSK